MMGLPGAAPLVFANPADSASISVFQTHRAFVDSCLLDLGTHVLSGFTPNRTSPLTVVSDSVGDSAGVLAAGLEHAISKRGLLIRDDTAALVARDNWALQYTLSPIILTLTEPQRREFLGKIWVKRTFHAGIKMAVHDRALDEEIWVGTADSTYSDWIPKSALKGLESADLSPKAPSTAWEKARIPIIVGAVAIGVAALMVARN